MREPSKILTRLTFSILMLSPGAAFGQARVHSSPTGRADAAPPQAAASETTLLDSRAVSNVSQLPALTHAASDAAPSAHEDPCGPGPPRSRIRDLWRQWWINWLRARRTEEPGQVATPFYLRSPLLSGIYDRTDASCAGGGLPRPEVLDECAEINLAPGADRPIRLEVLLPQLEVSNARRLEAMINNRLDRGESVVVVLRNGQKYPIGPSLTNRIATKSCATEELAGRIIGSRGRG